MSPQAGAATARIKAPRPGARAEVNAATRAGGVFDAVLILVFLALTFLLGIFPLKDTDFWWHLKAGDMIRQSGWVPTVDNLTFGADGQRWVDLHWIFQLLISLGYERFGVVGLNIGKCLITCLAVALLVTSGRREWPVWATLLAWIPALLVLSGRMYLRPETLTLLYLACDVAILARWDRRPWLAFALPVVQVAWVNSQGLFVFGPFLVGVALLDAATRREAFSAEQRAWWRIVLLASGLTVVACVLNPYGIAGAVYPIELLGTMGNPIFRQSIGELKPLATLFAEVGFDLLPLQVHLATMILGALSFIVPFVWRISTGLQDHRRGRGEAAVATSALSPGKSRRGKGVSAGKRPMRRDEAGPGRPMRWFRLAIFLTFSALSLQATRNSHQFAAMVGTITAWNFAEWVAEVAVRRRQIVLATAPRRADVAFRLATLGTLVATILAVGSGRFYAWSGEGRTIGLGEEPLWFPHEATRFAGGPGMPDRLVAFHNGHAALYEYEWGPGKKVYTDARLEVMGPKLYQEYLDLQGKFSRNLAPSWAAELDRLGHPAVLVDTVDPTNGGMVATLLNARRWHCVWFDPIAAVFVDDTYPAIVRDHEVDFLARHYRREVERDAPDVPVSIATARALRGVATSFRSMNVEAEGKARAVIALGLDYARRLQNLAPQQADGYKQAGLLQFLLDPLPGDKPIPRFRLAFDLAVDLSLVSAAYSLKRCLEIAPDEWICLYYLANLDQMRGMDEGAIPIYLRFADQPNKNLVQQKQKGQALAIVADLRRRLGPPISTTWNNLSEFEQMFDRLCESGRAETAADVGEKAHRDDARPWAWADRLATIRLHLGQPSRAREIWQRADMAPPGTRATRVAATYLVEGDFDLARQAFSAALLAEPHSFAAHYGLARLEQAAGRAAAAVAAAQAAERAAGDDRSRQLARRIFTEAAPYAHPRAEPAGTGSGSDR